ncbi:hypothetical protein [Rhodopseudomonas palustris]|uniref:hypothetical protein n=1 Tax=Rhodopseudomonas palustris TaxID=1076 RepID=UPI000E5B5288|nr:hypothetical protein [Rhodopseudomonas palustris]QLH72037.1 hypothetical protein HZF03_15060 [Rhodopseudomonas palustris]RHZ94651.1 hypothetical protein D1920_19860 [Rhodopseudomonas palustris]
MRKTIVDLTLGVYDHASHADLSDRGFRRYHPFSFDFDSTPLSLEEIDESWDESVKQNHLQSRVQCISRLEQQYGSGQIEKVVKNAIDLGPKSMSLLAYHNQFHEQARRSFVAGLYYPALVAACALGERILNHLVLDLRDSFKSSRSYPKVYRKKSFDNWKFAVQVLEEWNVLVEAVGTKFELLGELRNRSIHFDPETYQSLQEDALAALHLLNDIIAKQFGYFGRQPWFIEDTPGAQFVKRVYESVPFVRTYVIPRSGFVGPFYGMELSDKGWLHLDYADYGDGDISDHEFATLYRERNPEKVVSREMIERASRDKRA